MTKVDLYFCHSTFISVLLLELLFMYFVSPILHEGDTSTVFVYNNIDPYSLFVCLFIYLCIYLFITSLEFDFRVWNVCVLELKVKSIIRLVFCMLQVMEKLGPFPGSHSKLHALKQGKKRAGEKAQAMTPEAKKKRHQRKKDQTAHEVAATICEGLLNFWKRFKHFAVHVQILHWKDFLCYINKFFKMSF